jgi:hypothetical protein
MTGSEILTLVVAGYGAVLATYTALADRREKRRLLNVTLSNGFLTFGIHLSDLQLFVEACNPGARPVTVTAMGILLPDGEKMYFRGSPGAAELPLELAEGKNCRTWLSALDCAAQLPGAGYSGNIKLRGFADDATGRRFISKQFNFNVDEWQRTSRRSA